MSFPSIDRDALRRCLQTALTDLLVDNGGDTMNLSLGVQPPFGAAQNAFVGTMPSTTFNAMSYVPSASEQYAFLQNIGLHSVPSARAPMPAPLGRPSANDMLLTAKEEFYKLDHARSALLRQCIVQDSFQSRLLNKLATVNASPFRAFSQVQPPQPPVAHAVPLGTVPPPTAASKESSTTKALEALGSRLRLCTDPYIDVSFVQDQSPDNAPCKRARGGVTEPFPVSESSPWTEFLLPIVLTLVSLIFRKNCIAC